MTFVKYTITQAISEGTHEKTVPPPRRQISPDKAQAGRRGWVGRMYGCWLGSSETVPFVWLLMGRGGGGRGAVWFIMRTCMLDKGQSKGQTIQGGKRKKKKRKKGTIHALCIPSVPIHRVTRPLKIIIFQGLSLCQSLPHGESVQGERAVR